MTLNTKLETAQEAIREALISALQEKKDFLLSDLFTTYDKIKLISRRSEQRSTFAVNTRLKGGAYDDFWKEDGISLTGNPNSASYDTISFGAAQPAHMPIVFGNEGKDIISFS